MLDEPLTPPKPKSFRCPCDFAAKTGKDPRTMRLVGLADTVLYNTVLVTIDPTEAPVNRFGDHQHYEFQPCKQNCNPPPPGELPKPPSD